MAAQRASQHSQMCIAYSGGRPWYQRRAAGVISRDQLRSEQSRRAEMANSMYRWFPIVATRCRALAARTQALVQCQRQRLRSERGNASTAQALLGWRQSQAVQSGQRGELHRHQRIPGSSISSLLDQADGQHSLFLFGSYAVCRDSDTLCSRLIVRLPSKSTHSVPA